MGTSPAGALVLGADYRALGVARSLGRRGVPVWTLREPGEPLAATSRYVARCLPWEGGGDAERLALLRGLAGREGLAGWALIPSADETAAFVARHHEALAEWFTHTVPPWDTVRLAYDKRATYALAERAGVPAPRSARPRTPEEAVAAGVGYPAVIKPAIKHGLNALTAAKAWRVDGPAELARRFAEAARLVDPELLIVQELVPGNGAGQLSYAALCRDGEPVVALTARRTRQYPADFGRASTFVETMRCPQIEEPSRRLIAAMRWTGLIEVEYKTDPRDGVPKLLDVNPRVWGWHTLGARAGVDFPWLLWRQVCGRPVVAPPARPGVRWLRLSTDTPTAVRELVGGRLPLRDYLRSLRRPREAAIFAWDDPVPGLAELPIMCWVLARRLLAGGAV